MRMLPATRTRALAFAAFSLLAACSSETDGLVEPTPITTAAADDAGSSESSDPAGEVFTPGENTAVAPESTGATTTSTAPPETTTTTTTLAPTTTAAPATTAVGAASPCPPTGARVWEVRPASDIVPPPVPEGWLTESAGTSVQGRDLTLFIRPVESPTRTVLVIGGIHGNEPVSPPTVRAMVAAPIPDDTEVWLLPNLNPDGSAVGTRCNANGVDLNRNFSWDWRASTGGPSAFSEPEPLAAAALLAKADPDVVVWVHQPLNYVSSIGDTPDSYEQAWAAASGVPVRPDVSQHGGGESWTAFTEARPSMLIEINSYESSPDMVADHVAGFAALLEVVVPR